MRRRVEVQGHRGARGAHPENTVHGFVAALALGVDTYELDVGLSADGVVVVHHDLAPNPDVARDETGAWITERVPLRALSLAELRRLDVGRLRPGSDAARGFPDQVGVDGLRVPTLAEVIGAVDEASGGRVGFNVETKHSPLHPGPSPDVHALVDATVAVVREAGVEARCAIQSFDWRAVARARRVAPEIATGCLTSTRVNLPPAREPAAWTLGHAVEEAGSVPRMVHAVRAGHWAPEHTDLDAADVEEARSLGLRVVAWTVNAPADIARALDLGVDAIISDFPDRVVAALAARGWPTPPLA